MATCNELAHVSSEIDESKIKITFANQCIKAQEALTNKLKEEIQRRKEICNFKKNENLKLEAEIKNAELEIKNLRITHKTVSNANTEIKKDLLLIKERKSEITERIKKGENKYEEIWIRSKKQYESLPLVKELMQDQNKSETLRNDIDILKKEAENLEQAIKNKKDELDKRDKNIVIQMANFIVHEMPAAVNIIQEKSTILFKLAKEQKKNLKNNAPKTNEVLSKHISNDKNEKNKNDKWSIDDTVMIPKLKLPSVDMDIINLKLDISKVTLNTSPVKRPMSTIKVEQNTIKRPIADEQLKDNYISCYFKNFGTKGDNECKQEDTATNYDNKKLINILEDIKIDDIETKTLVAKADIDKFYEVDVIGADKKFTEAKMASQLIAPLECEEIEDIDLTNSVHQEALIPPTQFLDRTQGVTEANTGQEVEVIVHEETEQTSSKNCVVSQPKESNKKKVSFELPVAKKVKIDDIISDDLDNYEDGDSNDINNSEINLSAAAEDNYMSIKDMIRKKQHQLDLSPQFVYAKNTLKKNDEIVTSKFFESTKTNDVQMDDTTTEINKNNNNAAVQELVQSESPGYQLTDQNTKEKNLNNMDVDNAVSSPKARDVEKPINGLLFTHGPQGITDLDISLSTTGYEEGDPDFPNCLDSSLLLSPKAADMSLPMSGNENEAGSQDVPNFLSGFRKTGLSFFKQMPSDSDPDSCNKDQGNSFSFSFGNDEKKNRGLFSFFR